MGGPGGDWVLGPDPFSLNVSIYHQVKAAIDHGTHGPLSPFMARELPGFTTALRVVYSKLRRQEYIFRGTILQE